MKPIQQILFSLLCILLISACVPTKKYKDLERQSILNKRTTDSLRNVVDANRNLKYDIIRLEKQLDDKQKEVNELQGRFLALNQNNQDLLVRYNQLLAQNSDLLNTTSTEKQGLTEALAAKQTELDQKERDLRRLEEDLGTQQQNLIAMQERLQQKENQLNGMEGTNAESQAQLRELQTMLQEKNDALIALRRNINQALLGFTEADLQISEKNGKIYVSMSQDLLFAPGSKTIDWKGKQAIIQVAEVLKTNPDILVNVEGHTDADGTAEYNWDLSVQRATTVVKVLTAQGVDPKRVTASGRALYDPVKPNTNSANKAANRRTEIILSPKLDVLYRIINQ
jgi:chemotaxis protein MotB